MPHSLPGYAAVLVGLTAAVTSPAVANASDARSLAITRADAALAQHPSQSLAAPGDRFAVTSVVNDPSGAAHVRYHRTHRGLDVLGGDLIVHLSPEGGLTHMTVAQAAPIGTDSFPTRATTSVKNAAARRFGGRIARTEDPKLVVDATGRAPVLAHETVVEGIADDGGTSIMHTVTDAERGTFLREWDAVDHVAGKGSTQYSGVVDLSTTAVLGGYKLTDPNAENAVVCSRGGVASNPCTQTVDADNFWGNGTLADRTTREADAAFGVSQMYQLLQSWFGRPGIYETPYPILVEVDVPMAKLAETSFNTIKLGNGPDGLHPITSVDAVAHEVGHLLNNATASLGSSSEGNALNEANSDIYGTLTEFFADNATIVPNYTIGEQLNAYGDGKPLRYMYRPSLDGKSYDCWTAATAQNTDRYAVAGIVNKFFYVLAEGSAGAYGSAPTCGAPAATGIGRYAAGRIWHQALTAQFSSTTKIKAPGTGGARGATLAAATDLYGLCSLQYRAVQAAWDVTAVTGEDAICPSAYSSTTAVPIRSASVAETSVTSNKPGYAPSYVKVTPNITYPVSGALTIDLIAPNGTSRRVLSPNAKTTAYQNVSYTVPWGGSTPTRGTWRLRVSTSAAATGQLNGWTLNLD